MADQTVAGMAVGTHTDLINSFKSISGKLKKRFMRRPNIGDMVDQYTALSKWLEKENANSYAAFVLLAAARCEQAMSNPTGEADKVVKAAQLFAESHMESQNIDFCGFEEDLTEAIDCYELAVSIYTKIHRTAFAATLRSEMANALAVFGKYEEAANNYRSAASLLTGSPLPSIGALTQAFECMVCGNDHEGALAICVEIMGILANQAQTIEGSDQWDFRSPGDHLGHYGRLFTPGVYADIVHQCEVSSMLLLLLLPSSLRESHAFSKTLQRYKDVGTPGPISRYIDHDIFLTLQSVVLAVESNDLTALRDLQTEIWAVISPIQNELLDRLVKSLDN